MSTIAQRIEKVAEMIVEKHNLDYGNYEFFVQDSEACITIEAPSHATVTARVKLDDVKDLINSALKKRILRELSTVAHSFDAMGYFNKIYSPGLFTEGNKVFQVVIELQKDEKFFEEFYDEVMTELK